ncbi:MAG: phage DNA encapsidation protein [Acutalibacteraceae bacterium]|nr:phage DNA encapsidation protein [Acutalibacteraceae bacterium]
MWYDKQQLLSHNKILNMVLSNRGGGKTFHFTRYAIDKYKRKKTQTVWVRRYQTEIDEMLTNGKFFDAVREYYPDDELKVEGNLGYINGEVCIYFIALSTSRQLKSNNYPFVDLIVFDEFIIDKGRVTYLKSEVEVFLDLYETIARMRDNVRAVLLANSITIVNPYFLFWNIKPDTSKRFTVQGQVCVELFTDADFISKKKQTRFGQLVDGTRYGDYAIENKWLLDNETFIEDKSPHSEFMLGMKYNGIMYGFWVDYKQGLIYVNKQYDPSSYSLYCLTKDDHEANLLLIKSLSESKRVQRIVFAFRNGLLRFSDMQVKNQFYEYIGFFVR